MYVLFPSALAVREFLANMYNNRYRQCRKNHVRFGVASANTFAVPLLHSSPGESSAALQQEWGSWCWPWLALNGCYSQWSLCWASGKRSPEWPAGSSTTPAKVGFRLTRNTRIASNGGPLFKAASLGIEAQGVSEIGVFSALGISALQTYMLCEHSPIAPIT